MKQAIFPKSEIDSPDYQQAFDQVIHHLTENYSQGDRLPPVRELARQLGIGHGTANRVTRSLADEGLLVSRRGLGTYMSADLSKKVGKLAGTAIRILHADTTEPMIVHWVKALRERLEQQGASVAGDFLVNHDEKQLTHDKFNDDDALIVVNPNGGPLLDVPKAHCLFVHTGARAPVAEPCIYDEVSIDQFSSASLAGSAMRDAGVETVCYVGIRDVLGGGPISDLSLHRLKGFEAGYGKPVPRHSQLLTKSFGESWGARMVGEYLKLSPRPMGVFAASDELAVGFVKGALSHGLEPGVDYQIVGFDGQARGRELFEGPLTTVQVPIYDMAERGIELLIERFKNPDAPTRRLHLGCELFKGKTLRRQTR